MASPISARCHSLRIPKWLGQIWHHPHLLAAEPSKRDSKSLRLWSKPGANGSTIGLEPSDPGGRPGVQMLLVRVAPPAQEAKKALRQTQWANKSASPPSPQKRCLCGKCKDSGGNVIKKSVFLFVNGMSFAPVTSVKSAAAKPVI